MPPLGAVSPVSPERAVAVSGCLRLDRFHDRRIDKDKLPRLGADGQVIAEDNRPNGDFKPQGQTLERSAGARVGDDKLAVIAAEGQ
jgi:hypothetical protein